MNIFRPAVNIYVNKHGEDFLKEVMAGLEEEGVLCEVHIALEASAEELAKTASQASILEVGIGIDKEFICVTSAKLPADKPLLKYKAEEKLNQRLSGCNAARLVKRTPLIL